MTWNLKQAIFNKGYCGNLHEDVCEILREKLIEDFFLYIRNPFPPTEEQMKEIQRIINKRFGVK